MSNYHENIYALLPDIDFHIHENSCFGSGGIQRDWTGVPRKLFSPGQARSRCACIKNTGAPSHDPTRKPNDNRGDLDNPNIQEYKGCPPDETSCYIKEK